MRLECGFRCIWVVFEKGVRRGRRDISVAATKRQQVREAVAVPTVDSSAALRNDKGMRYGLTEGLGRRSTEADPLRG
jgi:hypothetical protein